MPKERKKDRSLRWSDSQRQAWVESQIAKKHSSRANDPAMQAKIDAQARELLAERVAMFGAEWHVGCAIRLPEDIRQAIERDGTDVVLLLLDREIPCP